ncbi:MAG: thioester domain-containing protein, partial [Clostridia bacterium]|nr:thioester domain-containing protein [Clostridia bacterium]
MKLNLKSMISHALCAALLTAAMLPAAVHAETPEERYAAANTYVLYYGQTSSLGDGSGARIHHASPYMTELRYKVAGDEPYREWTSTVCMYNQLEPKEELFVYCVDQYTSVKNNVYYHRTNIEDSSYFDDATAAKLRAITLRGFPHTDLKTLGAAVGIDDLWQGEAVHATQLAIWMTAYGKDLDVLQIVHNNDKDYYDKNGNKLAPSYPAPTVKVPYHLPKMIVEEIT